VLVTRGPASLVSVIGIAVGVVVVVGGPADVWVEEGEELENALVGARQAEQAAEAMADEAERLAAGLEPLTAAVLRGVQRAMR
jgi:hypothetical protein